MSTSTQEHRDAAPNSLKFAVLTVSDSRNLETDKSGQLIVQRMEDAKHQLHERIVVPDEPGQIAEQVRTFVAVEGLDVLLLTGGTGISPRDQTPEAVLPLLDIEIPGFGEMFRVLSYEEIGPATMLSRAFAGRIGQVLVFCLPGSSNAVKLAIDELLVPELPHLVHHSRG
ncbi:MAG: MogA/MoaB family molybdenum cofactor biosynthesis protein [Planctomycetota bacterium]|nr:MogA/MoaB family molybdenum cofactor biosynthesis protein [Planctomycetota bacterium]